MEIIQKLLYNIGKGGRHLLLNIIFFILVFIIFIILFVISLTYKYKFILEYNNSFIYKININTFIFKLKYIKYNSHSETFINIFSFEKKLINELKNDEKEKKNINEIEEVEKESDESFPFKLINKNNINHLLHFIIKIYKHIKPDLINLNLNISLSDPYYNGLILAYYYSIKNTYPKLPVNIAVNWQKEVIEGQGKIEGKITPIILLYHIKIFFFSPQSLKILWQLYKHYK